MRLRVGLASLLLAISLLFSLRASAQMSDNEKKSAARAAYQEGADLQEKGKWAEALASFEKAQKLYDAPTHLLHIAQCQAQLGHLVEASETYETLSHTTLEKGAPDAFKQAQDQGNKDLEVLKPRIPTLRVNIKPDPKELSNLQVNLNDKQMPLEMVGIARPINPGSYKITASATDYGTKEATTVNVAEKEAKSVDITLEKGVVVAGADTGVKPKPEDLSGPTPVGLLIGVRPLGLIPFGKVDSNTNFKDYAGVGGGLGIDVIGRVAQRFLVGGFINAAILSGPSSYIPKDDAALEAQFPGSKTSVNVTTEYFGVLAGFMPDVDHVTPTGFVNGGYRFIQRSVALSYNNPDGSRATQNLDDDASSVEVGLHAGVSIPAGPMRIIPLANFDVGQVGGRSCVTAATIREGTDAAAPDCNGGIYFMLGLSVGVYYHLDFGRPNTHSSGKIKSSRRPTAGRDDMRIRSASDLTQFAF